MKKSILSFSLSVALAAGLAAGAAGLHAAQGPTLTPVVTIGALVPVAATPDPAAHVENLARLFRAGDIAAMAQASVPPAQWEKIRTTWERKRQEPTSDADRAEFGEKLARVTAHDAVDSFMAELEPKLDEARPQWPGAMLMGFGAAQMAITSPDSDLTQEQRDALKAALPGLQQWVGSTDFFNAGTLRDALTLLTDAARRTGIQNLDQLKALPMDELLRRGNGLLAAAKDAVQLYGIDVDAIADSLQVEVLSNDGQTARVRTTVTVFRAPVFGDHELVLVDGQWYGKHASVKWSVDDEDGEGDTAVES